MSPDTQRIPKEELKKKRIGVLMGGTSAEREVSLASGRNILEALVHLGYNAIAIEVDEKLALRLAEEKIEVAFIGLHGRLGEDGSVQGLLEVQRIPYTGAGVLASALAMNKVISRKIFTQRGLPVPRYVVLQERETPSAAAKIPFPLPVVVKPCQEGSSIGVTIVREKRKFAEALDLAYSYGSEILVEEFIDGREISVGILDDDPLGVIEIIPRVEFYNYSAKYTDGLAEHRCPAPLPSRDYQRALELGLAAHQALQCEGGTRVDMLYRKRGTASGQIYILEVNTLPGMTELSLLPEIARSRGISFPELVERILLGARLKISTKTGGRRVANPEV
jgi:D-alanine-D-alanine ligase